MTRVTIDDDVEEEIEKAKKFYKDMEKDLDREDKSSFSHRHENLKFNKNYIILKALEHWNKDNPQA